MNDYTVAVIGYGTVGKGIADLFGEQVVAIYTRSKGTEEIKDKCCKSDMIVVCVPTPTSTDGMTCDTSAVFETFDWIRIRNYKGVICVKSAVPPSEVKRFVKYFPELRIVMSPEYMGESKYFTPYWKYPDPKDMRSHQWQVFGGERKDTSLCVDIFKRKMSVDTIQLQTDIMTAALTKYMENNFFALKVTFCNEWYDIAKLYGVDYNELRECWLADTRINRNHTMVFPKDRGYGGRCYPKDVKAIIADSKQHGYTPELTEMVDKVNDKMRNKNE